MATGTKVAKIVVFAGEKSGWALALALQKPDGTLVMETVGPAETPVVFPSVAFAIHYALTAGFEWLTVDAGLIAALQGRKLLIGDL